MRIWVDADACPSVIKDILINLAKQAQQTGMINDAEYSSIAASEQAMEDIIQVDYFDQEEYRQLR